MNIHRTLRGPLAFAAVLALTTSVMAQPSSAPAGLGNAHEAARSFPATAPQDTDGPGTSSGTRSASLLTAEQLFWECEQSSQTQVLGAGDAAICSGAYELLLKERFKGKFSDLITWWKRGKSLDSSRSKSTLKAGN